VFHAKVDRATRDFERGYEKTLESVRKLKDKINELELRISEKENIAINEETLELNSAIESLNAVMDSLIIRSGAEWGQYQELERLQKLNALDPDGLDELRAICEKTEQFAKDLLCYSLGRFKRKDQ
jgi:hypothetical protein